MQKTIKKFITTIVMILMTSISLSSISHAENVENLNNNYIYNVNPYYKYWKNNFIIYVDNYKGDSKNVSINDLKGNKGSSNIYIFSKLTDGVYDYDVLLKDIENSDVATNLHDKKPILVHLPKSASNNESHAQLKSNDEKGKLVTGGPYSKYEKYPNGFYYKDKLLNSNDLNKLLLEYKIEADKIANKLKQIESYSIKDVYKNVHVAYMTNGASTAAGTPDSKIYLLNVDKKLSPYNLSVSNMTTSDVIVGESTKNYLPDWQVETIYIYGKNNELMDQITFETFNQYLWSKQDKSVIEWMKSLNN